MTKVSAFRLPDATLVQLRAISNKTGMTLTQAVIVAIDRMAKEEKCRKPASK